MLKVDCPIDCQDIIKAEIADKTAEIIVVKYKYEYFKECLKIGGLSSIEKEILFSGLIAADLEDDKRYVYERIKLYKDVAVDGFFNFRLQPLKNKWKDIVNYVPNCFLPSQLKEFVAYLVENKKKRVFVDNGRVYDWHYKRLKRSLLLDGDSIKIVREVILSNCGEVELLGEIPKYDEYYLKEFFSDRIIFNSRYFN
jgi:hypothetical protein